jgi:hypothetical protein
MVTQSIKNKRFTLEEDVKIAVGVKIFGDQYTKIARIVNIARSSNQIRERWVHSLAGSEIRGKWSEEDTKVLMNYYYSNIEKGEKEGYARIARQLNRNPRVCRRRVLLILAQ